MVIVHSLRRSVLALSLLVIAGLFIGPFAQAATLGSRSVGVEAMSSRTNTDKRCAERGPESTTRFIQSADELFEPSDDSSCGVPGSTSPASTLKRVENSEDALTESTGSWLNQGLALQPWSMLSDAAKVRPVISVEAGSKLPYKGVKTLTIDGAVVGSQLNLGVAVTTPDQTWIDVEPVWINSEHNIIYFDHDFDPALLGKQIKLTFFIEEDEAHLPSSTSPRIYTVVDRPTPVITLISDSVQSAEGVLVVGVQVTGYPFVENLNAHINVEPGPNFSNPDEHLRRNLKPQGGQILYPYSFRSYKGSTHKMWAWVDDSGYTKAADMGVRSITFSNEAVATYTLPSGTSLRRAGTLRAATSVSMFDFPVVRFLLTIVVDGQTFQFPGVYDVRPIPGRPAVTEGGVYFDYSIPDDLVGKKAKVTVSHKMSMTFAAGSSSPRIYEVVK